LRFHYEIFKRLEFRSFIDKFGLNDVQIQNTVELNVKIAKNASELESLKNNILKSRKFVFII